jgi:FAD/FMN-containing dehydrogenase
VSRPEPPWDQLALTGRLLKPRDNGYVEASATANSRYADTLPAAVALCANEADVRACVAFARRYELQPVPRNGGHSYAGLSTTNGLLINLSALNTVTLNPQNGVAVVGGGALNQNVMNATRDGDWFLPVGTCPGVGVGGLTLGGGIGYNTHWKGLTCDHMTESRIVTAGGDAATISPDANPDLFWACQGGAGGSFGINTSFTFQLERVPLIVAYYRFAWTGAENAIAVLNAFHNILVSAPPEFNAVASATALPLEDGQGPRDAIGVWTRGQFIGSVETLRGILRPLLDIAGKTAEDLGPIQFWEAQRRFAGPDLSTPHAFGDISRYARAPLSLQTVTNLVAMLADCPWRTLTANGSFWSMGWVGGVVNDKAPDATAYVHRRHITALLRPTSLWPAAAPPGVGNDLMAWTDRMVEIIRPGTPEESYQNFPNRRIANWQQQYYGDNLARLRRVKRAVDPDNLFRSAQSIPPAE